MSNVIATTPGIEKARLELEKDGITTTAFKPISIDYWKNV